MTNNNLAVFAGKSARAQTMTDLLRLTGPSIHFDRIGQCFKCFLRRSRSIAIACGDAIPKTVLRTFTALSASSRMLAFVRL